MKCTIWSIGVALVAMAAANGGTCNLDIAVRWDLKTTYIDNNTPNTITGDGTPYVDGQDGVNRAVINVCSGTGDATLLLSRKRTISGSFAKILATNNNTPNWAAGGQTLTGQWFLNIRNVLYVPANNDRANEYEFTTRGLFSTPVVNYSLILSNPASQADPKVSVGANSPYPDSLVVVHHCPANSTVSTGLCMGIIHETWLVWPDLNPTETGTSQTGLPETQVASVVVAKGSSTLSAGEFSMPFYFVISTLQ